jgi:hypothetical protein
VSGCSGSTEYTADPIHGRVIDAKTGEPIAGAIVVFFWGIYSGSHGHYEGPLEIKEAITNENGDYFIPGWGPKTNPYNTVLLADQPQIIVFKPWYGHIYAWNHNPDVLQTDFYPYQADKNLTSVWDGRTIELASISKPDQYAAAFESLSSKVIEKFFYGKHCEWAKAPAFVSRISDTYHNLTEKGINLSRIDLGFIRSNPNRIGKCPNFEEVFGEQ